MKQEGLKQEVVTLHAPFIIPGVNLGGVDMFTNMCSLMLTVLVGMTALAPPLVINFPSLKSGPRTRLCIGFIL